MRERFEIIKWTFLAKFIFALFLLYQVDQLSTGLFNRLGMPSPFKIAFLIFPFLLISRQPLRYIATRRILDIFSVLIFWSFFTSLWSYDQLDSWGYTFQVLLLFSFSVMSLNILHKYPGVIEKLLFGTAIVGGFVSILSLLGVFTPSGVTNARLVFDGIGTNAISISVGYIFICSLSLLFFPRISRSQKIVVCIVSIFIFLMMIGTGTRSVVWGIFISLVLSYFFAFRSFSFGRFLPVAIIVATLYFAFDYTLKSDFIGEKVSSRLATADEKVFAENSRLIFWTAGIDWFSYNIFGTGAGVKNEGRMFSQEIGEYREAHSVFFSALIQYGFIGFIVLVAGLYLIVKEIVKIRETHLRFAAACLFIFFIIQATKGSSFQTRLFWHPLTLVLLFIEVSKSTARARLQKTT